MGSTIVFSNLGLFFIITQIKWSLGMYNQGNQNREKSVTWLSYGVVSEILGVSPPKNKCGLRNIWNYSSHHDPISHRFLVPCLDYFIYTSIGKNKRVVFNDPYWVNLKKCRPQRLYWCFQNMRHHQPIQPQVCLILIYNLIPQMCVVLFCYHR